MSTNRRTYDAEFKRNAVALAAEEGKTVSEVAAGLDVTANLVYRWRQICVQMHGLKDKLADGRTTYVQSRAVLTVYPYVRCNH